MKRARPEKPLYDDDTNLRRTLDATVDSAAASLGLKGKGADHKLATLRDELWKAAGPKLADLEWPVERVRRWAAILLTRLAKGPAGDAELAGLSAKSQALVIGRYGSRSKAAAVLAEIEDHLQRHDREIDGLLQDPRLRGLASHPQIVSDLLDDSDFRKARLDRAGRSDRLNGAPTAASRGTRPSYIVAGGRV
jgi:hypothetical protein